MGDPEDLFKSQELFKQRLKKFSDALEWQMEYAVPRGALPFRRQIEVWRASDCVSLRIYSAASFRIEKYKQLHTGRSVSFHFVWFSYDFRAKISLERKNVSDSRKSFFRHSSLRLSCFRIFSARLNGMIRET